MDIKTLNLEVENYIFHTFNITLSPFTIVNGVLSSIYEEGGLNLLKSTLDYVQEKHPELLLDFINDGNLPIMHYTSDIKIIDIALLLFSYVDSSLSLYYI